MTYDAADNAVVLFGGYGGWTSPTEGVFGSCLGACTFLNDTWLYKNQSWHNVTATAGGAPPATSSLSSGMAFDAADGYVVLYDGSGAGGTSAPLENETWEFHADKWAHIAPSGGSAASGAVGFQTLIYDSTDAMVVAVGEDISWASDYRSLIFAPWTFTYHAGVWTNQSSGAQPEYATGGSSNGSCTDYPGMVVGSDDPDGNGAALFCDSNGINGLATWFFSAGHWTFDGSAYPLGPPAFNDSSAVYDPALSGVVLYGGNFPASGVSNETWLFSHGSWTNLTESFSNSPPALAQMNMAWDGFDGEAVLFGGTTYNWGWSQESGTGGPGERCDFTWVLSNRTLLGTPTINARPTVVDVGVEVAMSAAVYGGTAPFSYFWKFGDGGSSRLPHPSHAYSVTGIYTVSLTLNDSANLSAQASIEVPVVAPLEGNLETVPDPTEVGVPTAFEADVSNGSAILNETWTFGDGSVPSAIGSHTYSRAGTFGAELNITDSGGGRLSLNKSVEVASALTAPVIHASTWTAIMGRAVTLAASVDDGLGPYSYAWSFGDGTDAGGTDSVTHLFLTTGMYTVHVGVQDALGAEASASATVTVVPGSTAFAVQLEPSETTVMVGAHVILATSTQGGVGTLTYTWFGLPPGCQSINAAILGCTPQHPGTAVITVLVADETNSTASANTTIQVVAGSEGNTGTGPSTDFFGLSGYLGLAVFVALLAAIGFVSFLGGREGSRWLRPRSPDSK
jgi:PKD repeat protein